MGINNATIVGTAGLALILLAGCAAPPREEKARIDPTSQPWYGESVGQLAALNRSVEDLLKSGKTAEAGDVVNRALPLQARLLEPSRPTLQAMEAISDLDDLYARVMLANHREGWARMLYQKNVSRWKVWQPQTAETERRLKQARAGLAECDRRLK